MLICAVLLSCAVTTEQLKEKNSESLLNSYIETQSFDLREAIILELERRKDVQTLSRCLEQIATYRAISSKWQNGGLDDSLAIVEAMGRLRNSEAAASLLYTVRRLDMKKLKWQILDTCRRIGGPPVAPTVTQLLKDQDADIRWQALDSIGYLNLAETRPAIYPLLSDINANVRMNAAHVLGKLGHADDSARISLLLMDSDISVRFAAERSLRLLNVPENKIEEWKNKAKSLTLDAVYSSQTSSGQKTTRATAGAQDRPKPLDLGNYHALVIGNNAYENLPKLLTAVNDARAVADLLEKLYGFKVTLILNGTRRSIVSALDRYRESLITTDNLLIYYAGHGYFDKGAERGYWLPVESALETSADWISNVDVTDKLKAIDAKHVMVIADSCYSGTLTRGIYIQNRSSDYITQIAQKRTRTVLTSGGNEPVLDSSGGNHSVFAKALLDALAENQDIIDGTQLFSQIRRPVMVNAPQTPQYSDIRFAGHEGGDFLFVRQK